MTSPVIELRPFLNKPVFRKLPDGALPASALYEHLTAIAEACLGIARKTDGDLRDYAALIADHATELASRYGDGEMF